MTVTPLLLVILDGVGLRKEGQGNAVAMANTPNFDKFMTEYPTTTLIACGEKVGLPQGQMGNSEVGHLNIGAGRIVYQDLSRISGDISSGNFFKNEEILKAIGYVKKNNTNLHICGLLSDGGVHSHIEHLFAILELSYQKGVKNVFIHCFLDGRDVSPDSAQKYIERLERKLKELPIGNIATIHGRYYAMDRDQRWERTKLSYMTMVYNEGKTAKSPYSLIEESYREGVLDEFVIPTTIRHMKNIDMRIKDNDAVIFTNFRPDRSIQLSQSLTQPDFDYFDRGGCPPKNIYFLSLTQYSDCINGRVAYKPKVLTNILGEELSREGMKQVRIAETEKYPHVTYFFNGGNQEPFENEDRVLVPSPKVSTYDKMPEMSAYELTDRLLECLTKDKYNVFIVNFANPDMVGHTGKLDATIKAVEVVDECLGKVYDAVILRQGKMVITSDHGNADMVIDTNGDPHTAHTTFPVPLIITDNSLKLRKQGILADIAPTMLELLGMDKPEDMSGESLIK